MPVSAVPITSMPIPMISVSVMMAVIAMVVNPMRFRVLTHRQKDCRDCNQAQEKFFHNLYSFFLSYRRVLDLGGTKVPKQGSCHVCKRGPSLGRMQGQRGLEPANRPSIGSAFPKSDTSPLKGKKSWADFRQPSLNSFPWCGCRRVRQAEGRNPRTLSCYFSFLAAWSPSLIASASLIYLPFLVLPYHFDPSLW